LDGRCRRGSERGLVPAARFDELLSRAAAVGVSVGHRAAQFRDENPSREPGRSLILRAGAVVSFVLGLSQLVAAA